MQCRRHALQDWLRCGGKRVRRGVGVRERKHARTKGVARTLFDAGEAEFSERVQAAAHCGSGEACLDRELRDGHLRSLRRERLNHEQTASERRHKVGIACVDVECRGRCNVRRHYWCSQVRWGIHARDGNWSREDRIGPRDDRGGAGSRTAGCKSRRQGVLDSRLAPHLDAGRARTIATALLKCCAIAELFIR